MAEAIPDVEPDYLAHAMTEFARVRGEDPAIVAAVVREQFGPFMRQVGRDMASLSIVDRPEVPLVDERITEAEFSDDLPDVVRVLCWALSEIKEGFVEHVTQNEIAARRERLRSE